MKEKANLWENTMNTIKLLAGESYIIKKLYIRDYGASSKKNGEKEWTVDFGKVLLLGRKEDISFLPNNNEYDISKLIYLLEHLYKSNSPFMVGNNFYYPGGIELNVSNKLNIPSNLNNIIYYGDRINNLGVLAKEVYSSVIMNNLELDIDDIQYRRKIKTKKYANH